MSFKKKIIHRLLPPSTCPPTMDSDSMPSLYDTAVGLRFMLQLPFFFRSPWTKDTALSIMRNRLKNRKFNFLNIARDSIFSHKLSPYARLFQQAGVGLSDLENLVRTETLEGALEILFQNGVFLTVDEFKGRCPVIRGSFSMQVCPDQLRNPDSSLHIAALTGGSSGQATPVLMDFDYLRINAGNNLLGRHYAHGDGWVHALWCVPGGIPMASLLSNCLNGMQYSRWFSQVDTAQPDIHPRYKRSIRAMRLGAAMREVKLPPPEHAPVNQPQDVIFWMQQVLAEGKKPHLYTMTSSAVSLANCATDLGLDLAGGITTLAGEPLTPARHAKVSSTGLKAMPEYGAMEMGSIGAGCQNPLAVDEVHVQSDRHGLIQAKSAGAPYGIPEKALFFTSLFDNAPFVLINYSAGDMADLSERDCGCPLYGWGWNKHLSNIVSYEKITAGGTSFIKSDLIRVLDETLPAVFGGGPADYQLVVEESPNAEPRLLLLASPVLGKLDSQRLGEFFLREIAKGDEAYKLMSRLLKDADYLKVERRYPQVTIGGKIFQVMQIPAGAEREV